LGARFADHSPVSNRALTIVCVLLVGVTSAAIAFSAHDSGDFAGQVEPAVRALAQLDLSRFFALQPAYGSLAAIVEAPFVALALLVGAGPLLVYQLAILPCLLAIGALGVVLARLLAARGSSPAVCIMACGFTLLNPATLYAISLGHPEELLATALVVAALLAAGSRRPLGAAVLIGLALATKQWALLALPAVVLVSPRGRRLRATLVVLAVAGALTAPLIVADSRTFSANARQSQGATLTVSRFSIWWPIAPERTKVVRVDGEPRLVRLHRASGTLTGLGRPLAVLLAFGLALAAAARRRNTFEDGLALVALALLLRCVIDPVNASYYHVPFLLSLLAWESLRRGGLPLLTLLSASALAATFDRELLGRPVLDNAFYLGWTLVIAAVVGLLLYAPRTAESLQRRLGVGDRGMKVASRLPHASGT
jgi:hypothetical protein